MFDKGFGSPLKVQTSVVCLRVKKFEENKMNLSFNG